MSVLSFIFLAQAALASTPLDVDEKRRVIIEASIDAYSGNCPCPYNLASNGSRCGKRSAWSHPGGDDPFCFNGDIDREHVDALYEIANSGKPRAALLDRTRYRVTGPNN